MHGWFYQLTSYWLKIFLFFSLKMCSSMFWNRLGGKMTTIRDQWSDFNSRAHCEGTAKKAKMFKVSVICVFLNTLDLIFQFIHSRSFPDYQRCAASLQRPRKLRKVRIAGTLFPLFHHLVLAINTVTLLGRAGADPQQRGNAEHPIVTFSVATHNNYKWIYYFDFAEVL